MMQACEAYITESCELVRDVEGDAAEIGVWRGESARLICELLPTSTVHLFDTCEGIPASEMTPEDGERPGKYKASEDTIRKTLDGVHNWRLHVGVFPETAIDCGPLKLVHVDCDLAKTARHCIEWAWPRLAIGGVILFDDYGAACCGGLTRVVRDWATSLEGHKVELDRRLARVTRVIAEEA